jgi:type IV pilus assembly protein PilY1
MYRDPVTNQLRGNEDGGHVISYIGDPTYASNPVGDHSSGLIRSLDDVRAQTWTPFAEGFYTSIAYYNQNTNTGDATKPHRLNTTDFSTGIATAPNPVLNTCQRNHILLITDGMSTTDQNAAVMSLAGLYNDGDGNVTTTASASGTSAPKYFGSQNIDDLAWFAQHKNITNPSSTATIKNSEKVRTDVVYSGEPCANKAADGITCTSTSEVIPERLMQQTAANGGGTYHLATNQPQFRTAIQAIFEDIAGSASSGTAASVLASGEGSGANLIQAVFYPRREFDGSTEGRWLGRLTNLWYYVDPRFSSSGIYDDSGGSSLVLNVTDDKLVTLYYDATAKQAKAHRVDDINDDGVSETPITPDISVEDLASLWDGGVKLWKRTSARKILTSVGSGLIDFSSSSAATLRPYLQAADNTEAANIINYVNGTDIAGYRSRTVTINATTTDAGTHSGTWKLGDIIQSTPRIAARFPLNNYYDTYRDSTYNTYYTDSAYGYTNRGIVFAGANDGMLHAFYLGKLELSGAWKTSTFQKAQLSDPSGIGLGKEIWGFIPKNVLPYLKYYTDTSYCHLYSVDLTPTIVDVAIGEPAVGDVSSDVKTAASWRTVLIGGMRLGGACKRSDDACTDCVKTPGVDLNSNGAVDTDAEKTVGLSSYFALDITDTLAHPDDPANYPPVLLWEYSDEDLGFSTSGPTIVKINVKSSDFNTDGHFDTLDPSDTTKNGKYFVAFGSGPTGGISTADHQFLGKSMQELRIFVLDLKSGTVIRKIDTGVSDAFAGSMVNASLDVDLDYQDDVVYIPYTRKCTVADTLHPCTSGTWTNGGVLRLLTKEDLNPANWTFSTVIDGSGAVTASVGKLLNTRKHQLWIFFGSGRYFFEQTSPDDPTNQRQLYGLKDPCYGIAGFDLTSCPSIGSLRNVTNIANVIANVDTLGYNGWYINMANAGSGYRAEREITDPLASISGFVLFTTFQPKDDNCSPGGRSFIWAVKYDSGGAPGAALKGKGLLQVSTGSIEEVNLASRFTEEGGRKTTAIEGVPPTAQGLSILATPPPVKRTIHIKER